MGEAMVEIEARGIEVRFDPVFGMIAELRVKRDGRVVSMLHKAPWHGEQMPDDAAPHLGRLAGDFFCAPFGDASADGAPGHGWPANSSWSTIEIAREGAATIARFKLDRPAMGATLIKELRLVDDHPFLYQRHVFTGGRGESISVANHAMLKLSHGARLSFSPKRWWETPETGLETDPERGRGLLAYPAQATDFHSFPARRRRRRRSRHFIPSATAMRISPSASRRPAAPSAGRQSQETRTPTSISACATQPGCR